jgi:hypothetical protein
MATLKSSLSFKGIVFPIDINTDYITNTEGKSTEVYFNYKVLTLMTGEPEYQYGGCINRRLL